MCSYDTMQMKLEGSAKRQSGWTGIELSLIHISEPTRPY